MDNYHFCISLNAIVFMLQLNKCNNFLHISQINCNLYPEAFWYSSMQIFSNFFIPYAINIYIILWCQISHLFFANSIYKCIVISILFAICHTETISAVCLKYSTCNSFLVFQFSTPLYGWEVSCSSIQFFFESFSFHLSSQLLCATNAGSRGHRKKKFT